MLEPRHTTIVDCDTLVQWTNNPLMRHQDLFRFHNRSNFEIHVYATTPNDSQQYIDQAMDGVDWRAKVEKYDFVCDSEWCLEILHDEVAQHFL